MVHVKIKKLHDDAITPSYVHAGDSGMDVFALHDDVLHSLERKLISTGLSFEVPEGYEIQTRPKSGLASKYGITVLNTPGTLDSGYRGELFVILFNAGRDSYPIKKNEKIAQIVLQKVEKIEFEHVQELSDSSRGSGGLGSTGLQTH